MSDCSHPCGGRCCSDFFISAPASDIGSWYEWAVARIAAGEDTPHDWDMVYVAEMLIRIDEDDETRPRYTCKHFLSDVGLCGAYAQRPRMCREFPYGRVCDYGCGYQNVLPELVTITPKTEEHDRAA